MAAVRTISWYENQLNNNKNLSPAQIEEYEQHIERLADLEAKSYQRRLAAKEEEKKKFAEIKAKLESGDASVIDLIGIPEFGGDYELSIEGAKHIVYSKVARDDQDNRHVHIEEKEAIAHYRKLIWDRLYTKYVRSGEVDSLKQME